MQNNKEKGDFFEQKAVNFLKENNYKILKRNYKNIYGEIDIICENIEYIVFVEVKYRRTIKYGYPREAVNIKKQNKIKNVALLYISEEIFDNRNFRFDVIEILDKKIIHIENAFY